MVAGYYGVVEWHERYKSERPTEWELFSCIFASVGGEISFVGFLSLGPLISGFTLVLCCHSIRREKFSGEM